MNVIRLIVAPGREEHVARHGVDLMEVEEIVFGNAIWRRVREKRYLLLGQTAGGRYVAVVLAPRTPGVFGLVTARDANDEERRLIRSRRR